MANEGMTRRTFIAVAGASAAWAAIPSLGRAQTKTRPIIGSGEHTYECYHDWLTPPEDVIFGDTHGLALDQHGHIYLAQTVHSGSVGSNAVQVYDQKGKLVDSWGAQFRGGAHGLDLRKEDGVEYLYHCDTAHRNVTKTTLKGEVVWTKNWPKESGVYASEDKYCPTNVAFDPNGDVFVSDGYGSSYIHRYSKDGDWKEIVVRPGKDVGLVNCPHGLWVDTRTHTPKLVVCDRSNNRLQEFTLDGKPISVVTEGMRQPCHIHYNHGLALLPGLDAVVSILDKDNKVVVDLGDGKKEGDLRNAPREKFVPGEFVHPHSAIWINKKDIVVAEWVPIGRVTLLKRVS